jgi:hypothetical protein
MFSMVEWCCVWRCRARFNNAVSVSALFGIFGMVGSDKERCCLDRCDAAYCVAVGLCWVRHGIFGSVR